jgi:Protein of unknown function (DUF3572)
LNTAIGDRDQNDQEIFKMTPEMAEAVAIRSLQHIAGDRELLHRFLDLTGLSPQSMREAAISAEFLPGVLEFFMADEPALVSLAASIGESPATIANARAVLLQGSGETEAANG